MYLRDQIEDINRVRERDWFNESPPPKKKIEREREKGIKSPSAASESGDMPSGRS